MLRKYYLAACLITCITISISSHAAPLCNTSRYTTLHRVSGIMKSRCIQHALKGLLGEKYDEFIDNYDVFGEPKKIHGGGLLVEGWLKDLHLYRASAFAILPNGNVYAGYISNKNTINYYTKTNDHNNIQPDIKIWASRFKKAKIHVHIINP